MNPRPTEESYKIFYRDYFWEEAFTNQRFKKSKQKWNALKHPLDNNKIWSIDHGKKILFKKLNNTRNELLLKSLGKIKKLKKNSKILEVGAGIGTNLKILRDYFGSDVFAIEPSTEARKEIKKNNIEVIGLYAKDLKNIKKNFDIIIFSHSLENTINPEEILKYAKSLLKNGSIYIQCSNLFLFDQMNPYHPFIFSYNSFKFLSKKLNMKLQLLSDPMSHMLEISLSN